MFIQIKPNPDGSHALQSGGKMAPGWAVVPDDMVFPDTFPYINIKVEEVTHPAETSTEISYVDGKETEEVIVIKPEYTQLEVVSMSEGAPIEIKEPIIRTIQDDTDTMLIDHEYRLTLLELGLSE